MNPSTTTLLSAFATLVAGTGASSAQEDCQTPRTPGGAPANLEHAIERSRQFAALVRADQKKPGLTAPCLVLEEHGWKVVSIRRDDGG